MLVDGEPQLSSTIRIPERRWLDWMKRMLLHGWMDGWIIEVDNITCPTIRSASRETNPKYLMISLKQTTPTLSYLPSDSINLPGISVEIVSNGTRQIPFPSSAQIHLGLWNPHLLILQQRANSCGIRKQKLHYRELFRPYHTSGWTIKQRFFHVGFHLH